MKEDFYITLLHRSFSGLTNASEEQELKEWLAKDEKHQELKKDLLFIWNRSAAVQQPTIGNKEQFTKNALYKLRDGLQLETEKADTKVLKVSKRRRWLQYAAVFLLAAVVGLGWNYFFNQEKFLIAKTTKNETKQIHLPDGTLVWLNENSFISYPAEFNENERQVRIEGQAYFEVFKKKNHPFIIDGWNSKVKVLGTQFDFQSYSDDSISMVNVLEGKVAFSAKETKQVLILTKDMQGYFDVESGIIQKRNISALNAIAWKTQNYEFDKSLLVDVFALLEKNFDVEISYKKTIAHCAVNGKFENASIETILNTLSIAINAKVIQNSKNTFEIIGGGCKKAPPN